MTAFDWAFPIVYDEEKGLVDHPRDPGGITNHGISLRFALGVGDLNGDGKPDLDVDGDGDVDADDIRKLTREQAADVYRHYFWRPLRCEEMPCGLALMVFDTGVNQGRGPAITLLQEALGVKADGKIGPVTIAAIQKCDPIRTLKDFTAHRMVRYATTKNFDAFGLGWMRRAVRIHDAAMGAEVH